MVVKDRLANTNPRVLHNNSIREMCLSRSPCSFNASDYTILVFPSLLFEIGRCYSACSDHISFAVCRASGNAPVCRLGNEPRICAYFFGFGQAFVEIISKPGMHRSFGTALSLEALCSKRECSRGGLLEAQMLGP